MTRKFWNGLGLALLGLMAACGGGGGDAGSSLYGGGSTSTTTTTTVTVGLTLSSTTVTSAAPATVTATVVDGNKKALGGVVVTFAVSKGLGSLSATTALTDSSGVAKVTLSPADSTQTGADEVSATATYNSVSGTASAGFQLTATTSAITSVTAATGSGDSSATPVGPYGQTVLTVVMSGVSANAPATVTLTSACVAKGKATISPTSTTTTTGTFTVTYTDSSGCGSILASDTVTATLAGSSTTKQGTVYLTAPSANSLTFVSASPSTIYLKGSGLTESSTVVFQLNDTAGNALPGQKVAMALTTYAGGLQIDGGSSTVTKTTDAKGQVQVIVNSGTVPTPVRVSASLVGSTIVTVSNQLAVGVGLPSQLNFSLSAKTLNIEGGDIDGTTDTFTVYAADRSGNPVPEGTALTFWAEGGQVQTSVQTKLDTNGLAVATANFVSQSPRPDDGRVTIVGYAIGEESFVDLNGDNQYTSGEPFQDLGDIVKDKLFDNSYDSTVDEYVSLSGLAAGSSACALADTSTYPQLALDRTIPVRPATCDAQWTSRTYVRRAIEIVLSKSSAGVLWRSTSGLGSGACHPISRRYGPSSATSTYYAVSTGDVWYGGSGLTGSMPLVIADSNAVRLNPMPAGTTVTATNPSSGLTVTVAGSPVPNTTEVTAADVQYTFATGTTAGQFTLNVTSPGGLTTSYVLAVAAATRPSTCP